MSKDVIQKYKKKNGQTAYMFNTYLGRNPLTNKSIKTTRRGFKTRTEAKRALTQVQLDYDLNGWHNQKYKEVKTFDDLFNFWFESYKLTVKETTANYRITLYERYLKDTLGNLKIKLITPELLQKMLNEFAKTHSKVGNYKVLIDGPLKYAVRMDILLKNPFDKVVTPRTKKSPFEDSINFYSKDELSYFLKCLKKENEQKKYIYFRLLAYTGMRKSEGLALYWSDFNVENKTIRVDKTINYDTQTHEVVIHEPKTKASKRVISLDSKTVSELQKWHLEQNKWLFAKGFRSRKKQLIFSNEHNLVYNPGAPGFWLGSIYNKYPQKEIRIHGFRHTHASLLFEAGATIKEVQSRLGHSTSKTTLDIYSHVMADRSEKTGENFADFMEK